MGTDYFLADPVAKEIVYIDRCGSDFCCVHPSPERREVPEWPRGPVRVVTPECLEAVAGRECLYPLTLYAVEWCVGRNLVLLVDDTSMLDEESHDFCHQVVFGGLPGWTGFDLAK